MNTVEPPEVEAPSTWPEDVETQPLREGLQAVPCVQPGPPPPPPQNTFGLPPGTPGTAVGPEQLMQQKMQQYMQQGATPEQAQQAVQQEQAAQQQQQAAQGQPQQGGQQQAA